jgi:tripartite ATP-independent transporter DctP family solute receptor
MKKALYGSMAVLTAMLMGTTASSALTMKASHSAAPTEPYHIGLTKLADDVKACTNGEVQIEVFPNSQLGNEKEAVEGILLGTVDIVAVPTAIMTNFAPELGIFDLPFLFRDRPHMYAVMDGPVGEEVGTAIAGKGFKLLGFFEAGIRHIMTTDKPVETIDDLKGLKIRTMQNPVHVSAFQAFGANPTPLAYGELYGALESGVVDGAEAANSNYHAQHFFEVAPNWALVSWTALVVPVVMAAEKWNGLTDAQKACFDSAMAEAEKIERSAYEETDQTKLKELEAAKVNITRPDPAPFREAAKKVYDQYLTDEASKKRLEAILAQ